MICIYAKQCNSETCPHRLPHPANDFCTGGSCSWGENTRCVPESKREMLEEYLMGLFPDERIEGIADAIESIYKEVTHE